MWWFVLGILIGFVLGACGQDRRWRKNADVPWRIYSWRRLYKVQYADKGKEWE